MIHKATQEIYDALKAQGLKAFIEENGELSTVYAGFSMENGAPIQIRFISTDEDNDVAVRVTELMRVEAERVKTILPVLNRINNKYRYVKFILDGDNDIGVQYDLPLAGDHLGACAVEMIARFVKIIREAYPELMRTIWQ
ncbi:MAG: YbjN domain-containing protein [Clostridia bacterium]|nr:YbjN domain-containing protein [Clostridia bacterium]